MLRRCRETSARSSGGKEGRREEVKGEGRRVRGEVRLHLLEFPLTLSLKVLPRDVWGPGFKGIWSPGHPGCRWGSCGVPEAQVLVCTPSSAGHLPGGCG